MEWNQVVSFSVSIFLCWFGYHKYMVSYINKENDKQEKDFVKELEGAKEDIQKKLDQDIYEREKRIFDEWRKEKDEAIQSTLGEIKSSLKELTNEIRQIRKG